MAGRVVSTQATAIELGALFVLFLDGSLVAVPADFLRNFIRDRLYVRRFIQVSPEKELF